MQAESFFFYHSSIKFISKDIKLTILRLLFIVTANQGTVNIS